MPVYLFHEKVPIVSKNSNSTESDGSNKESNTADTYAADPNESNKDLHR